MPAVPGRQATQGNLDMTLAEIDSAISGVTKPNRRGIFNQKTLGKLLNETWTEEDPEVMKLREARGRPAASTAEEVAATASPRLRKDRLRARMGRFSLRRTYTGKSSRGTAGQSAVSSPSAAVDGAAHEAIARHSQQGLSPALSSSSEARHSTALVDPPRDLGLGRLRPDARRRPLAGVLPLHPFECLVFKGGGAKGAIYPGAIKALEDAGIMPYVKRFGGASAGSVVAALLAAGLSAKQLFRELANIDLFALIKGDCLPIPSDLCRSRLIPSDVLRFLAIPPDPFWCLIIIRLR